MGLLWVGRRRPWHEILLISLASSLLYEGCNKSSQTKTCANSTPDLHFLLATGQLVLEWQTVLLCSIVNTTILHSTVTSAPKHGKVLKVDRQIWRKGQFFSRAMVDFSQLGHCHIWHHLVAGVAIVMPFWGWWWWLKVLIKPRWRWPFLYDCGHKIRNGALDGSRVDLDAAAMVYLIQWVVTCRQEQTITFCLHFLESQLATIDSDDLLVCLHNEMN